MKISASLAASALALSFMTFAASAPADAAETAAACSSEIVQGSDTWGDRAFGSCTRYDRSTQQARITADCIYGPDRNTAWFHDYKLHYTGYCGSFGVSRDARSSFVSFRN